MIWYLVLVTVPVLAAPVVNTFYKTPLNADDKAKRLFLFFAGAVLFLLFALKSQFVGEDSWVYYGVWEKFSDASLGFYRSYLETTKMEEGFLFSVWCLSKVFKDAQFIFVITGAFYTFSICRFIYKNSKDVLMSFVMFVALGTYEMMFQVMRQAIAMSICLFAIEFCKKRKLLPFILLIALASSYHRTALIFFVVYFLYNIPANGLSVPLSLAGVAVVVGSSALFANLANEFLERDYVGAVQGGGYVALAIYCLIILLTLILLRQIGNDKNISFFFFVMVVGLAIFIMRYTGVRIAERASYYFIFGQMVVLPNIIQKLDKSSRQILKVIVLLLCISLFAYGLRDSDIVPYKFFWQ